MRVDNNGVALEGVGHRIRDARSHHAIYSELLQDFLATHRSGTRTS
jgi:hypothetical protein